MAFNPDEPRDLRGKWTTYGGGGVHTAPGMPFVSVKSSENAERAKAIAEKAAVVATKLGYDPHDINVSDESKTFELNGKTMPYAGWAQYPKGDARGTITLFSQHLPSDEAIAGVTAHEIMHQKFQAFTDDHRKEYDAMMKDPAYLASIPKWDGDKRVTPGTDFMKPNGSLYEPYAAKYPAYSAWVEATRPSTQDFSKSDGVSSYSRDWWDAWHKSAANTSQVMHETLAEIARVRLGKEAITHIVRKPDGFVTTRKGIDPIWNKLYNAVEDHWKRRNK